MAAGAGTEAVTAAEEEEEDEEEEDEEEEGEEEVDVVRGFLAGGCRVKAVLWEFWQRSPWWVHAALQGEALAKQAQ